MARKLITLLLTIELLTSCNAGDSKNQNTDPIQTVKTDFKTVEAEIPFAGFYLSEDYLAILQKTKSPRKAQEKSDACFIIIPNKTLTQTIMIYNFHESGAFLTVLKNQNNYEIWETNNNNGITNLFSEIKLLDNKTITINNKKFIKYKDLKTGSNNNNHSIIEQFLFSGTFENEKGETVKFEDNGKISGFQDFKYYNPIIDYFDVAMQIDQVGFGLTEGITDWFGFKIQLDTLYLHEIKCIDFYNLENFCGVVDFGDLLHKLWRKE